MELKSQTIPFFPSPRKRKDGLSTEKKITNSTFKVSLMFPKLSSSSTSLKINFKTQILEAGSDTCL